MQQQKQEIPARRDEANSLHSMLSDKMVLLLNEILLFAFFCRNLLFHKWGITETRSAVQRFVIIQGV